MRIPEDKIKYEHAIEIGKSARASLYSSATNILNAIPINGIINNDRIEKNL